MNAADLTWWQQILVYIFAPTGVLAGLLNFLQKRKRKSQLTSGYEDIYKVQMLIQELLCDTKSNRVMLFRSENGGGIPKPGSMVKNTAFAEACDSAVSPLLQGWQAILADRSYADILHRLISEDGFADVNTHNIPVGTEFRDLLEMADSSSVRFVRVCALQEAVIYLGVFYNDEWEPDTKERYQMRTVALQIRQLFRRHHNLIQQEAPKH